MLIWTLLILLVCQAADAQWAASQMQRYVVKDCLRSSWSVTAQGFKSPAIGICAAQCYTSTYCTAFVFNQSDQTCQFGYKHGLNCASPLMGPTVTVGFTYSEQLTFEGIRGNWTGTIKCAPGSFIIGFMTQIDPYVGPNSDDSGMNSIGYMCNSGQEIWNDGYWGTWESTYHACNGGFDGLKVKFIKQDVDGDLIAMTGVQLHCITTNAWIEGVSAPIGNWTESQFCPPGKKFSGARQQMDKEWGLSGDDTSMNGIEFDCT